MSCEHVRPRLAELARRGLSAAEAAPLESHLAACEDCAREAELVGAIRASRPAPPPELLGRIQSAVRADQAEGGGPVGAVPRDSHAVSGPRRAWHDASWRLAAAAVVVLALGTAVVWPQVRDTPVVLEPEAPGLETPGLLDAWDRDAGIVAGAPVLEELSDEALLSLLEELEG